MPKYLLVGAGIIFAAIAIAFMVLPGDPTEEPLALRKPAPIRAPNLPAAPAVTASPQIPGDRIPPILPSFDVVQVSPAGETVMAGRAAPGATVSVMSNGEKIGETTADSHGEWVYVAEKPLPAGTREITLETRIGDEPPRQSATQVVVAVPAQKDQPVLAVEIGRADRAPRVLQGPAPAGKAMPVTLESVNYGVDGRLILGGRTTPHAEVQVYVDDKLVERTTARADGTWEITPPTALKPGPHTLRADQLDAAGTVVALAAIHFSMPENPQSFAPGDQMVVQPGHNLWYIARRTYGSGLRYSIIFEANANQIHDPDLIYPGQIFALPR